MERTFRKQITKQLSASVPAVARMDCLYLLCDGIDRRHGRFVEKLLARVLARDTDPVVRHEAAFTLGELYLKGKIGGAASIVALCQAALHDCALIVRHEAVETLGWYPFPEAMRTLKRCIRDQNGEVVATARIALERYLSRNRKPTLTCRHP